MRLCCWSSSSPIPDLTLLLFPRVNMGRQDNISVAILRAVYDEDDDKKMTYLKRILYFFNIVNISLARSKGNTFRKLRREIWEFDDREYRASFNTDALRPAGDLGYSGSVSTLSVQTGA